MLAIIVTLSIITKDINLFYILQLIFPVYDLYI